MPRQPRHPRSADEFADAPDLDREWTRPGPDYRRSGPEEAFRQPRDTHSNVDRADYGDYGTNDVHSFGGVPREVPHANYPPHWVRADSSREGLSPGALDPHPHERSAAEAFGFAASSNYPYAGIASAARRGRFFGRGPKGYRRSDERIREEISDRLMTHPDVDASDLEVRVENGVVSLVGTVEDRHEKRLVEYIAEDVLGVNDVENRLKVRRGFWAAVIGERAQEKELPPSTREADNVNREIDRKISARNAAQRDAEAR
jgi:hypothetical protein